MWRQLQLPGMESGLFVYIGVRNGVAKIGLTREPQRRARQLRLHLLLVLPGGPLEEKALHRRFADARIDREWFFLTPGSWRRNCAGQRREGQSPSSSSCSLPTRWSWPSGRTE